jgi:hypothetical protein
MDNLERAESSAKGRQQSTASFDQQTVTALPHQLDMGNRCSQSHQLPLFLSRYRGRQWQSIPVRRNLIDT